MKRIDLSFPTPEENLACDEALLDHLDSGFGGEMLRFWESSQVFVVLGFANKWKEEVKNTIPGQIPILRRVSGGGCVLQGPGCLNYSLILDIKKHNPLSGILSTNAYVMNRLKETFSNLLQKPVQVKGSTDLTVDNLKFSGNAQRKKKNAVLFHGTILLNFPLDKIEQVLKMPPKEPDYRENRSHLSFITNLNLSAEKVKNSVSMAWDATEYAKGLNLNSEISKLVKAKYALDSWNLKY